MSEKRGKYFLKKAKINPTLAQLEKESKKNFQIKCK